MAEDFPHVAPRVFRGAHAVLFAGSAADGCIHSDAESYFRKKRQQQKKKKKPTGERWGKAKNAQVTSQEEQCWGPRLASPLGLLTSAAGDSNGSCVISLRFPTATHTLSGPTWALLLVPVHEALRPH